MEAPQFRGRSRSFTARAILQENSDSTFPNRPLSKGNILKTYASPAAKSDFAPPVRTVKVTAGGQFTGYASLFGVEDQGRDVVVAGAFRASLDRRPAPAVRLLFQHDPAQPIGVWDDIREDARGLHVRGHLIEEVVRAREVMALIRAGALDGLSIGFHARKAVRDARTGQRRLFEIDLLEISIVTFPMLPGARVTAMKAHATAAWSLTRPKPAPDHPSGRRDVDGLRSLSRALPQRARKAWPGEGACLENGRALLGISALVIGI
jgi:HK97 family phage prohead protease